MGVTIINPNTLEKKWLFADQENPALRTVSEKYFIMEDEHNTLWMIPNGGTFSYYDRAKKNWYLMFCKATLKAMQVFQESLNT